MNKPTDFSKYMKKLKGLTTLKVLQKAYSVRFRFLDEETGFHYYEVHKLGTSHKYTVKIKFIKLPDNFLVRESFSFCPCPRFKGELNCQHFLLSVYTEAVRSGYGERFDFGKFADFRLAKVYQGGELPA